MNESRKFVSVVIASGLDFGMITPDDVMRHVTMDVLAHHLPTSLKARLLAASLQAKTMNATLVLDTLGVEAIVEHLPITVSWACIAEAGGKSLGMETAEPLPAVPKTGSARSTTRKPNRNASASQMRTSSRRDTITGTNTGTNDFDGDTSVGSDPVVEVVEEDEEPTQYRAD